MGVFLFRLDAAALNRRFSLTIISYLFIFKERIETMGVKMIAFCCRRAAKCSYSNKAKISDEFRINTNHAQNDGYAFHKEREKK